MGVAIGVDTHKGSLAAAAVDGLGRILGAREFRNDPAGHRALLEWARGQGEPRTIGVEGSGTYGAGLARVLASAGEEVREVPATLTYRERRRKGSQGKSDPVDAVAIARVVARDGDLPSPRRVEALQDLKLLSDYRDQLVRSRTQVANRIHHDLVVLRPGYERSVPNLVGGRHLSQALVPAEGRSLRPSPARAATDRGAPSTGARDRSDQGPHRPEGEGVGDDPDRASGHRSDHRGEVPGRGGRRRQDPLEGRLRGDGRDRPPRRLLRAHPSTPAEPRREPSAQLRPALHGARSLPLRRGDQGLHRAPAGRGQVLQGGHALSEASPVQRRVPADDGGASELAA
jgi:hypothetical protein